METATARSPDATLEWARGTPARVRPDRRAGAARSRSSGRWRGAPALREDARAGAQPGPAAGGARLRVARRADGGGLRRQRAGRAGRRGPCWPRSRAPHRLRAAATLALAGDPTAAEGAMAASRPSEADDLLRGQGPPCRRQASLSLARGGAGARARGAPAAKEYELGTIAVLTPSTCAGLALLQHGAGRGGARAVPAGARPPGRRSVLAALQLSPASARAARAQTGTRPAAARAYDAFSRLGGGATPTCPCSSRRARMRLAMR
jgi:hypothetical protein